MFFLKNHLIHINLFQAVDPDFGRNSDLTYSLEGKVQATISEGLEKLRKSPFVVDPKTGIVTLNFDPQRGMKGYFDFEVSYSRLFSIFIFCYFYLIGLLIGK